jgi:preprotein translocase subunit SecY
MLEALRNAFRLPDLRNKLLITGLILVIYQFAAHVPVIGVDRSALRALIDGSAGGLVGVLNLLSGGAVKNFSVIANGVYPYITASIIFQLLVPIIPQLEQLQREPGGKEKIETYTYYLAIPMAILQSVSQINIFNALLGTGQSIIPGFGSDFLLTITVIVTMTAGTMFAIWLGQLITEQGIGNGLSIIIFSGIVAQAPQNLVQLLTGSTNALYNLVMFIVITLVSIVGIIIIQEGVRRIPVQYGKRVRGRKQYGGASTHIPLKVNPVGMIPLIFAQSIITFPALIVSLFPEGPLRTSITTTFGQQQGLVYWLTFFLLVVGFTFFYSDVMVGNQNLADNLQRNGGFIPGIRPGKRTDDYIRRVTRRITLVGALFLGIIAITPGLVDFINRLLFPNEAVTGVSGNAALVLTGSGLIIVVGVVIDTMRQLEAQLVMRNYDRFMR